jgi:peptidoglycan/LPS O-acetylase OafA/YrhL
VFVGDVSSAVGTALYLGWLLLPGVLVWHLHRKESMSWPATAAAGLAAILATAAGFYVATTDSSSTAPLLLLFSPLYVMAAVLVVFGAERALRGLGSRGARD